ncbi:MAG: efflux transporter outer membrane subunit [Burkholderiaceae bacterium]|nr:efflux transporter outer membrane subunit [Burkholderiaceae bacterium]
MSFEMRCKMRRAARSDACLVARRLVLLAVTLALGACTTLEPELPAADASIPAQWPLPPTTAGAAPAEGTQGAFDAQRGVVDVGWRDFFVDAALERLIERALAYNRDLRAAALNVERAQALYRVQRAEQMPAVGLQGTATRASGSAPQFRDQYSVSLGLAAFEIDLFGRVRSLSRSALEQYFATESAQRSVQLSLVAEVANAYLTWMADREATRVAQSALANREQALDLTRKRYEYGAVGALDVSQAETSVEQARTDASRFAGQAAQDLNALRLLVGAPIDEAAIPDRFDPAASGLRALPAGVPSEVLLRRPDVEQAEHLLRAANADIGAARAAFFPSIRLTGAIGTASTELSGLFGSGSRFWSFGPQLNLPIFEGGALRANLRATQAARDIALARYERAIQVGFREVADALALTRTLSEQKAAQLALVAAAARAEELSRSRYEAGRDSYLVLLDAQRTLYGARQSLIATQLAEQANRVTLYRVLGGGWNERTQ